MPTSADEELDRVVPVVAAVRAALPDVPISIDTTKPAVAEAALAAGADLVNDVWGVGPTTALVRVAAARGVPLVVMHNRAEPRYDDLVAEVVADLRAALERAVRLGVAWERADRGPGVRLRQDGRAEPRIVRELGALRVTGPADPAGHVAQVDARHACWTCRSASAWRGPWRRPRSGSPRGRTSSASTTSAPTSVPPG